MSGEKSKAQEKFLLFVHKLFTKYAINIHFMGIKYLTQYFLELNGIKWDFMSNTPFFVPEYYTRFQCKGGDCRRSCCGGWPISISMEEYFRFLGMECSPELRDRLDRAIRLSLDASEEHYASICPNYVGDCPLHMENGLCRLHFECGAEALSDVCRLFPRATNRFGAYRCVCSAACEHTVELLTEDEEPLRLVEVELPDTMTLHARPVELTAEREAVRKYCLDTMQDRTLTLHDRIDRIALYLQGDSEHALALTADHLYNIQVGIAEHYAEHSESVGDACRQALAALTDPASFASALVQLEARFPSLWIWLEKLFVNYMLQECFPYTDREREVRYEGVALCGLYAFCLFLLSGCLPEDRERFIDLTATIFRLVGHSAFDHNVIVLIKNQLKK